MVTVRLEDTDEGVPKKSLSDSKIRTLEIARARSLEVRRERASAKLEGKFAHAFTAEQICLILEPPHKRTPIRISEFGSVLFCS
jgi:hypothetical protein